MPSSNPELDAALKSLSDAGHIVGTASVSDQGTVLVPIDGVPRTYEDIFQMANDEQRKPGRAKLTGKYVRMVDAPNSVMGTLGDAVTEHGNLQYLFTPDPRFKILPVHKHYVVEADVEECARPTDAEVAALNYAAENEKKQSGL